MEDMDQEIRDAHGGDLQDNIETAAGTKKWAPTSPEIGSAGESSGGEGGGGDGGGGQEFPRASEGEVIEAAERAKAQFGGTYEGGGKGPESEADTAIAQGEKPGPFQETGGDQAASGSGGSDPVAGTEDLSELSDSEVAGKIADEMKDQEPQGDGDDLTTGQKLAGIMASDPNMQAESKIVGAVSGGDDDEATGNA